MLIMASCSSNTPKAVAEKSMKCLVNKDYNGYVELLDTKDDSKSAKQETPEEIKQDKQMLAAMLKDKAEKEYKKNGGIASYETLSEDTDKEGKTAIVNMKVTYGNGSSEEEDIRLCKDADGNWKLSMGK